MLSTTGYNLNQSASITKPSPRKLSGTAIQFLAARGLNDKNLIERCGITEVQADAMERISGIAWQALKIPYGGDFFRYRFLPYGVHAITADNPQGAALPKVVKKSNARKGDGNEEKKEKRQELRYWQPAHSGVRLYMPPLIDWAAVMADYSQPLIIAEGEFKSIAAVHVLQIPACGIGGVWNWKPSDGLILPEFKNFKWHADGARLDSLESNRTVFVVFDSDVRRRSDLLAARDALVWQLTDMGANPRVVNLPESLETWAVQ
jgi:uncharacterized protein DUF3854